MLSQPFKPMATQLSKKAVLPLAEILATESCRSSEIGPCLPEMTKKSIPLLWQVLLRHTPVNSKHQQRRASIHGLSVPAKKLCVYIYIYICIFYMSSEIGGRIYTCNRSVIVYWWSCTQSHSIGLYFWGVCSPWVECHFLFSLVYQLCLVLWW